MHNKIVKGISIFLLAVTLSVALTPAGFQNIAMRTVAVAKIKLVAPPAR